MAEPIISIITTHNNRLQCLLNELTNGILKKKSNIPITVGGGDSVKFFNGSILKVVIEPTDEMTIDLLNTGDYKSVEKTTHSYWISNKDANESNHPIRIYLNNNNNNKLVLQPFKIKKIQSPFDHQDNTMIFYIIRHGQAEHNIVPINIKYDTNLVGDRDSGGKFRLIKIGKELYTEIADQRVSYGFTSDLTRTQETLELIFQGIADEQDVGVNDSILKNALINILPCSHELNVTNDSKTEKCDGNQSKSGIPFVQMENKLNGSVGIKKNSIDIDCKGEKLNLAINKQNYTNFYNGKNRNHSLHSDNNRRKCRETNMLELALEIIKNDDSFPGEINDNAISIDSDLSTEDGFKYNTMDTDTADSTLISTPPAYYNQTDEDRSSITNNPEPQSQTEPKSMISNAKSVATNTFDKIKGFIASKKQQYGYGKGKTRKHNTGKSSKKPNKVKSTIRTNKHKHHKKTIRFHPKIGGTKKNIRRKNK
jgi:hypothetical protein